jgi:hypothetical protein
MLEKSEEMAHKTRASQQSNQTSVYHLDGGDRKYHHIIFKLHYE